LIKKAIDTSKTKVTIHVDLWKCGGGVITNLNLAVLEIVSLKAFLSNPPKAYIITNLANLLSKTLRQCLLNTVYEPKIRIESLEIK
jgi:hypothetical protein